MPPPKGLSRREGTTDHGKSYEQKIAALLGVKCALHDDIEDMWIATNVKDLGAFDDLVLFLQKKGSIEVYLIQIKHKNNGTIKLSGKNDLTKYQESFVKIREGFLNGTLPLKDSCECKDIKFVLFTNTKFEASDSITFCEYSTDFINTGKMFQISYDANSNYDPDFLNQTFFYHNQVDALKVQDLIKYEIDKYFLNYNVEAIIKFFEEWHMDHFENKVVLEKKHIQSIIQKVVLSNYIPEPTVTEFIKADIWNEVTSQFQYTFLKEDCYLSKIWQGVNLQMCNFFNDRSIDLLNWNRPLNEASIKVNKIRQCCQKIELPIKKVKGSYSTKDLYILLWQACKLPLILNLNTNINSQKDIFETLSRFGSPKDNRRRYIFFGQVTGELYQYSTHFNIIRLNRDIQEKALKNSYVSLQDKEAVALKELKINDAALEKITPELLIQLLLQPITKNVEDNPIYIPRSVRQPIVADNVLTIPKVVFVILAGDRLINYQILNRFGGTMPWHLYNFYFNEYSGLINVTHFNLKNIKNVILNKDAISLKESKHIEIIVSKFRCQDQTIHYLKFLNEGEFQWLHSNKNADQIKPFLVLNSVHYLPDSKLFEYLTFNILCGNTGEGKSTLLQFLADHSPTDVWVIKLNIREIDEYTKKGEFSEIKKFLYQQNIEKLNGFSEFWWELFQSLYNEGNILVIIDGIDEAEYNVNTNNFLDAIKSLGMKTILAARPSLKNSLEEKFKMPVLFLNPFTNDDCKLLLKRTLHNKYDEEGTYINEILKKIFIWGTAIGIPLLLKLFISLFSDRNFLHFSQFDITDLFDRYISEQLNKVGSCNKFTMRTLSRSALFVLYKEDAISELFTIEEYLEELEDKNKIFIESRLIEKFNNNKAPIFAHKSIAEFLVAKFLHELALKLNNDILQKFLKSLFYQELETVRIFFDIIALKDSGLQDIITGSDRTKLCNRITKDSIDKFGRHALHIVASYGSRCQLRMSESLWSSVRTYEYYNNVSDKNTIEPHQNFERNTLVPTNIVYQLLEKGLDPFEKDNLFKMDAFEFAIESGSLLVVEALFSKNFIKQLENVDSNILLFHVVKNGCINMFKKLEKKNYNLKILPVLDNLLHIALCNENFEMIKELTERIPIDELNAFKYTPLISWLTSSKLVQSNEYVLGLTMTRNLLLNDNQTNILRHLINKNTKLNAVNILGETPLHAFCGSQEQSIVELLIQNGADVNRRTHSGATPLHYASSHSLENVKLLLRYNSKLIHIYDTQGLSPLYGAALSNKIDIVKYLIKKGAHVNRSKNEVRNPLNAAVAMGHVDCVKLLLEEHAKISNSNENNTMQIAALSGNLNCIKLLLQKGSRVDERLLNFAVLSNQEHLIEFLLSKTLDISLNKLFLTVISVNNINVIDIFISKGVDVNKIDEQIGDAPLHLACLLGLEETVRHLIKYNSDVNIENNQGRTPMILAAEMGHLDTLKILIGNGSDLQKYGSEAIYSAARNNNNHVVEHLLLTGANINGTNLNGFAPIHHASENNLHCVKNLVRHGANINLKTLNEGLTPLMIAAKKGLQDVIEYLIENGAKVNEEDILRNTALAAASNEGHLECVKLLIYKGSDLCKYGPLSISIAATKGHTDVADYLISTGADINGNINNDFAPIHVAISQKNLEAVKYLLDKGADINLKTRVQSQTPLILATIVGRKDIVKYLLRKGAN